MSYFMQAVIVFLICLPLSFFFPSTLGRNSYKIEHRKLFSLQEQTCTTLTLLLKKLPSMLLSGQGGCIFLSNLVS